MKTLSITSVVLALMMAMMFQPQTFAQPTSAAPGYYPSSGSVYHPHYPRRYGPIGPYYRHASTAAEGYLNGMANRVYAQGLYNRLTAEARTIHAQADSQEIANRQQATDAYFAMRETNRAARAAARGKRAEVTDLAARAKTAAPNRPGQLELSSDSGQINWPELLQEDEYAGHRRALEYAFLYRKANGSIDAQQRTDIQRTANAMLAQLKTHVREISPMEYVKAQQFIKGLSYEAQLPVT